MKHTLQGFSTLELLIAFAVMTLCMTAVIMVAFGNQSTAIDTELAQRGLYIAQQRLEEAGALLRFDFNAIASDQTALAYDDIFDTQISIDDISPCLKEITSTSLWERDTRSLDASLSSIFTSPEESRALGGDCATQNSRKPWDNPVSYSFSDPIDAGNQATAVDIVEHGSNHYAILATKWKNNKNTLFVIDATDPSNPVVVAGLEAKDKQDFTDVDAYFIESTNEIYAFVASASTTAQLQIFKANMSNPSAVTLTKIAQAKLPQLTNGMGRTLYYYDNHVYIGTQYVACTGACAATQNNEFHIFDVKNPANPTWQRSVNINHNINDIAVLGNWAYLATSDDTREVAVLQINPSEPQYLSHPDITGFGFNAAGTADAQTLAVSGQYVYAGRGQSSSPELYALRASDLRNGSSVGDGAQSSINLESVTCTYKAGTIKSKPCISGGKIIRDVALDGSLAFIITTESSAEFQVWDIANPSSIHPKAKCNTYEFPAKPVAIDYSGDYGFVAVESNDAFRVVYDNNAQVCMP